MKENNSSLTKKTILTVIYTIVVSVITQLFVAPLVGLIFNTESKDFYIIVYIVGLTATVIACTLIILEKIDSINK